VRLYKTTGIDKGAKQTRWSGSQGLTRRSLIAARVAVAGGRSLWAPGGA
jgi:hypothetical protein